MSEEIQRMDLLVVAIVICAFSAAFFAGPYSSDPHFILAGSLYAISGSLSTLCRKRMVRIMNAIHKVPYTENIPLVWGIAVLLIALVMILGLA